AHLHDPVRLHRSSLVDPHVGWRDAHAGVAVTQRRGFLPRVAGDAGGNAPAGKDPSDVDGIARTDPAGPEYTAPQLRSRVRRPPAPHPGAGGSRVHRLAMRVRRQVQPGNFFWGSFDLAVTRFSGRRAPSRDGPAFERDAYSHEVISHGFWPGSGPLLEPAFYAYAVPQPAALKGAQVQPDAAYYHQGLGEFILPYEAVRTADAPDRLIHSFIDSTYDRASVLAHWDRQALDRPEHV